MAKWKRTPLAERFWARVKKTDGCWIWNGALKPNGYGEISRGGREGKSVYAHRAAWELSFGPIPEGLSVCHQCDNRRCVRLGHLFLGSQADNMADMRAKGREARGGTHGAATHPEAFRKPKTERGMAAAMRNILLAQERPARGEGNGMSKITAAQAAEIRHLFRETSVKLLEIAARYGISKANASRIGRGELWGDGGPIVSRPRGARPGGGPSRKLTPDQVLEIRRRRGSGERLEAIAADFGVRPTLVSAISHRKVWRHLP